MDGVMRYHGTGSEDHFNGGWYALMDPLGSRDVIANTWCTGLFITIWPYRCLSVLFK